MDANKKFSRELRLTQEPKNLSRVAPRCDVYRKPQPKWWEKNPPLWAQLLLLYLGYLMFAA